MAQLRDSIITGDLRVTGTIYGEVSGYDAKYVNTSGDTMTGALNLANGTYNKVGDDVQIGDVNKAGRLGIKGINGATGIEFVPYSGLTSQSFTIDGTGCGTLTGLFAVSNSDNTVTIGSQNANFTHIYNSANIPFIFNKNILVTEKHNLGDESYPFGRLQLGTADDGIYYKGSKANYRMIRMIDNTTDANGNGISIGGGGLVVIGAGEFANNLISTKSLTGDLEDIYIGADGSVFIEAGGNTIANRIGIQITTSGNILPIKAEAGNNNAQSLGTSSYKWANVYATTFHGALDGNASTASSLANFKVTTTANLWAVDSPTTNAVGYQSGLTKAAWNYQQTDGATYVQWYNANWIHQIFGDYRTGQISVRGKNNGTWQSWRRILDETNGASILGLKALAYKDSLTKSDVGLGNVNNQTISVTSSSVSDGTNTFSKYTLPTASTSTKGGIKVGSGLTMSSETLNHSNSITAKTAAAQSAKTLTWGGTFTLYEEKYDAQGHITGVASYNMTMPANPNTDIAVKQTATNSNHWRKVLVGYQYDANPNVAVTEQTNQAYVSPNLEFKSQSGTLKATEYSVNGNVTLEYNSTTESLDFVF